MWHQLLIGAAVGAYALLLLQRLEHDRPVAALHPAADPDRALRVIGNALAAEYARTGVESSCCITDGLARIVTPRRTHARIAAALSRPAAGSALPLAY